MYVLPFYGVLCGLFPATKLCNFTSLYGHKVEGSGGPCTTIPPPTTTATVTDTTATISEPGTTPRTTTAGKVKLVDPLEPEDYIFLIPKSEQATTASSFSLTEYVLFHSIQFCSLYHIATAFLAVCKRPKLGRSIFWEITRRFGANCRKRVTNPKLDLA